MKPKLMDERDLTLFTNHLTEIGVVYCIRKLLYLTGGLYRSQ